MTNTDLLSPERARANARRLPYFIPLVLMVPVLYWAAFHRAGIPMNWAAFGLGAAGWTVALALRGPVALLAQRFLPNKAEILVVSSSGPLEEGVRVALLLWTGTAFPWAAALGMGWAAVEVLFTIINALALNALITRDDEQARQARELLASRGNLNTHPGWGVLERISASAVHIGFTLIVAANPMLVLLSAPVHSLTNIGLTRLAARSMARGQLAVAVTGVLAMAIGLLFH